MMRVIFVIFAILYVGESRKTNTHNCPELVEAANDRNATRVRALLWQSQPRRRCSVHSVWGDGSRALHRAAARGDPASVHLLLQAGAAVGWQNRRGQTALHAALAGAWQPAAATGHRTEVVAALALHGSPLLTTDEYKRLPLHYAAKYGKLGLARLLLAQCSTDCRLTMMRAQDAGGYTAAELAHQHRHTALKSWLNNLLTRTMEPQLPDDSKNAQKQKNNSKKGHCTKLVYESKAGRLHEVESLMKRCHVDSTAGSEMRTALHWAVLYRWPAITATLLNAGATVDARDSVGRTPLYTACYNMSAEGGSGSGSASGRKDAAENIGLLLLHGADPMVKRSHDFLALHCAADHANWPLARLLLTNCDARCRLRQLQAEDGSQRKPFQLKRNSTLSGWLRDQLKEAAENHLYDTRNVTSEEISFEISEPAGNRTVDKSCVCPIPPRCKASLPEEKFPQNFGPRFRKMESNILFVAEELTFCLKYKMKPQPTTPYVPFKFVSRKP